MPILNTLAPDALEAAARQHLDSAHHFLAIMEDTASDVSREPTEGAFWQHLNTAWQLIQHIERAESVH